MEKKKKSSKHDIEEYRKEIVKATTLLKKLKVSMMEITANDR